MINSINTGYGEQYVEKKTEKKETKSSTSMKKFSDIKKEKEDGLKTDGKEDKRIRQIKEAIDQVNHEARMKQTACEYSYDDATNRIAIKVKDKETDEVIREIPAEETLEMLAKIREQAGLMIDEKF